jgi:hypothetical protein
MTKTQAIVPAEKIESRILLIRGQIFNQSEVVLGRQSKFPCLGLKWNIIRSYNIARPKSASIF